MCWRDELPASTPAAPPPPPSTGSAGSHPTRSLGWDGKGVSNQGCGEEQVCCSCPWTWEGSPSAGGHSTGDQPQQSELPAPCRVCQHPCAASPQGSDCLTWKSHLALPRSGHSTELRARQSHGEDWEGLDYWSSGSGVSSRVSLSCFQLLCASSCYPTTVPALLLQPAGKHCPVQEPARLSPRSSRAHSPSVQEDGAVSRDPSSSMPTLSSSTASPCGKTGGTGTCSALLLPQPGFIHFRSMKKALITRVFKQWC